MTPSGPLSIGLLGNAAEVVPELLRRGAPIDIVTDQTSAHDPLSYLPIGIAFEDMKKMADKDPVYFTEQAQLSMARHVEAMVGFMDAGAEVFDYGNSIRDEARKAGYDRAFDFPGFVPAYIRPQFEEGLGPFRWAALSGDPKDIAATDKAILELFPDNEHLKRWITLAGEKVAFEGLPARICWLGYGERHKAGLKFNEMVASGELSAPIVIGRDHLDSGSVASPYRETEAMADGSDAIADWPLLNALVNTASGASWVSIHHGGGVGHGPLHSRRSGDRRRRHRTGRREAGPGADQRPGHGRHPACRRRLRARHRGRRGTRSAHPHAGTLVSFDGLWGSILDVGRDAASGGYRRFAWTTADLTLREWFTGEAQQRGMTVEEDRNGNLWAWWLPAGVTGDPRGAFVTGSHLDSVPDGGAFDGPLGIVSAFAAIDLLRADGVEPRVPVAVVAFSDEEGARFGVACVGSQLSTGALTPERALGLRDGDGTTLADALTKAGRNPAHVGADPNLVDRVGVYVELHVEQGRALDLVDKPIAVASAIWPHGRWLFRFCGEANHAGATRLVDRRDPMLTFATSVHDARARAAGHDAVATFGKVRVTPNGANAIPSAVEAWLDARAPDEATLSAARRADHRRRRRQRRRRPHIGHRRRRINLARRAFPRRAAGLDSAGTGRRIRRGAGTADRRRTRRRDPVRQGAHRNVVRPQPDRRLALPRRVRRDRRLPAGRPGAGVSHAGLGVMTTSRWWCEHAWLGGDAVADAVTVTVTDGVITALQPDSPRTGTTLRGLVIPGLANAHSHAFHRALRSRTQRDRGSFWTWRKLMYAAAGRLTPDLYRELARAVYAEMALAGITAVGEFHYLHHDTGGRPYSDPNAMGHALIDAAREAGIRLTLLDTCYLSSGVDGAPLGDGPQQRFGDGDGHAWAERVESLKAPDGVLVGAAIHSVRAVPVTEMAPVVDWAARHGAPLHIHSSEQTAEVDQCLAVHGCTPTALMRDNGVLGARTTAVHATHLTERDIDDLRSTATGVCFCPTTERDLGDGVGTRTGVDRRVGSVQPGLGQPCRHRPVRGGPRRRTRRTAVPS